MIYFKVKDFSTQGFETKRFVYVCNEKGITTDMILRNPKLLSSLKSEIIEPKFIWFSSESMPLLTFSDVYNSDNIMNLTGLSACIEKQIANTGELTAPVKMQLINKLAANMNSEKLAQFAITAVLAQLEIENKKQPDFPINLGADVLDQGEFKTVTAELIAAHNAKFKSVFSSINDTENVTMHQDNCSDTLFIKIPDRAVLLDDAVKIDSLIPRRAAVCTPYSDKNAYSSKYKELGVPKHLYSAIEGRQENNYLPIQENEKKYYDALTDWVKYNIKEEFGNENDGIIDGLSKVYLTELADRVYSWHWAHNVNVPTNFIDDSDDEDDNLSSESSSSVESKYEFSREFGDGLVYDNAIISLNSFLEEASTVIGFRAYVEAIVKLARWGERKPKALVLDDYEYSFDLAANRSIKNINIADYKVKLVDGKRYELAAWITPSVAPQDVNTLKNDYRNTPFGVALKSTLVNETGDEISIPIYYSMFDAIPLIQSGELSIVGVEQEGETLVCPEVESIDIQSLVTDYVQNTIQFQQNPFYRSAALKDLCLQFKTGKGDAEQNLMVIFNEVLKDPDLKVSIEKNKLATIDDLKRKIANYEIYSSATALNVNVASTMISVMDKVLNCEGVAVLEQWRLALKDWGGLTSFYTDEGSASGVTSDAATMTAFDSKDSKQNSAGTVENNPVAASNGVTENGTGWSSSLIRTPETNAVFRPIVDLHGKTIGAYAKELLGVRNGKKIARYVLIGLESLQRIPAARVADSSIGLNKMMVEFVQNLVYLSAGKKDLPVTFESTDTLVYFRKAISVMMKEVTECMKK